ncbi:hypothetical protein LCGC14_2589570, partial [marine sediment metagenome]
MSLNFGKQLFAPRGELIQSFDYFDIAEGLGYDVYYGSKGNDGEYLITTSVIYSEDIVSFIEDQSVATSATKYFDLDFDIVFNQPKNVKGKVIANIPIGMAATTTT